MISSKVFFQISSLALGLVAFVHIFRLIRGFDFVYGGWEIPNWVSLIVGLTLLYLSYSGFKLGSKKK